MRKNKQGEKITLDMEHDNYLYNAAAVNNVLAGVLSNFHCFSEGYVEHVNMKSKSPGKVRLVLHNLVGCL